MLNENAKKLVAALRSGEFKQGHDQLRTKDKFCCLGVACELAAREGVIPSATERGKCFWYENDRYYLPKKVQEWLGFNSRAGNFTSNSANPASLSFMNDRGVTFDTIAYTLESEPKGLFAD